jgi:hypothetical protein
MAIVSALAVLGLVMVLVANNLVLQEAEAGCENTFKGGAGSFAFNQSTAKSQGKCLDRGTV